MSENYNYPNSVENTTMNDQQRAMNKWDYSCYPSMQQPVQSMCMDNLIATIQNCEATCEHMVTYIITKCDMAMRTMQLRLLNDCKDICTMTAKFVARDSMFARNLAQICSQICHACSVECAKFPDAPSQHCAQVCLHCARECHRFAMGHM